MSDSTSVPIYSLPKIIAINTVYHRAGVLLTQSELAERAGVEREEVTLIEKGLELESLPQIHLGQIADALEVPVGILFIRVDPRMHFAQHKAVYMDALVAAAHEAAGRPEGESGMRRFRQQLVAQA